MCKLRLEGLGTGPRQRSSGVWLGLEFRRLSLNCLHVARLQGHLPGVVAVVFFGNQLSFCLIIGGPGGFALDFFLLFSLFICSLIVAQSRDYMCGLWIRIRVHLQGHHLLANGLSFCICGMERIVVPISGVYYED